MSSKLEAPEEPFDASLDVPPRTFQAGRRWRAVRLRRTNSQGETIIDRVHVSVDRGREVFEGDIDLTPKGWFERHLFGLSIRHGDGTWPGGHIHYVAQRSVSRLVEAAVQHWMSLTPLRFSKGTGTGTDDYLSFEDRGICRSRIGRATGPQLVELDRQCSIGTVVHEIGHAIGLWHEHSRFDRDQHVRILSENIQDRQHFNFDVHDGSAVNRGAYDLNSVMHYPSGAYTKNGRPTILTHTGNVLPPRQGLSAGDLAAVRELYPELSW